MINAIAIIEISTKGKPMYRCENCMANLDNEQPIIQSLIARAQCPDCGLINALPAVITD